MDFKDLETKGYILIPSFLSEEELNIFKDDISDRSKQSLLKNENYSLAPLSQEMLDRFADKFYGISEKVLSQTNIKADFLAGGAYFSTRGNQSFGWHQDHESYFLTENHYHYLNLYMPIIKPEIGKTNLCLVPFDRLKSRSPELYTKILDKGAMRYKIQDNKTIIYNDNSGRKADKLEYSIEDIAETPYLNSGDLLLIRGDVIHRTQDTETLRTALSVRIASSQDKIVRDRLVKGGVSKFLMMVNNRFAYQVIFDYLDNKNIKEFSATGKEAEQYIEFSKAFNPENIKTKSQFFRYLIWQKIKAGSVFNAVYIILYFLGSQIKSNLSRFFKSKSS